jgi:hypothetical protein
MILPECLYTRPVAIHPSRLRATARNAGVPFNFDGSPHNAHSTVPNKPRFRTENGRRCPRARCSLSSKSPQAILPPLKSHR